MGLLLRRDKQISLPLLTFGVSVRLYVCLSVCLSIQLCGKFSGEGIDLATCTLSTPSGCVGALCVAVLQCRNAEVWTDMWL